MITAAAVAGYLIGSLPTAIWLGRLWGVDLRRDGSGNPGANNARRLGGYTLALLVLIVEIGKGLLAVVVGLMIGDEAGGLAAGLGLQGGKGLGISGGVILGLWPAAFPIVVIVIAVASALTKSTGAGSLVSVAVLLILALVWDRFAIDARWGLDDSSLLVLLMIGLGMIVGPRHWQDARRRFSAPSPG
jgi:glycerol-3-phosphate acyltransferase PlsY